MKKFITALMFVLFGSFMAFSVAFAAADTWTQKADFGGGLRTSAVAFSIGSKGYMGTGFTGAGAVYDDWQNQDFWEYDPALNIWTQKADFGGGKRYNAAGFSIGNKGYIGTGSDGYVRKNDFWEYDPAANTWTRKADFGGAARSCIVAFSIRDKGYFGTGDNGVRQKEFWEYNPATDVWTQKADFGGEARMWATGFSIGSKGYIGMGMTTYYNEDNMLRNLIYKDFWEYDPALNTWTRKADFKGGERLRTVGFSIGNKGFIGTGVFWDESYTYTYYKDFWEYDPVTDTWTKKADFGGTARNSASGFSVGNKGYIGTGAMEAGAKFYTKDFWEYESAADTTPDPFIFNYETDVDLNTVITSNTITVSGINAPAPISITGGTYSINGGMYTNENGTVNNGDTVTVQQTSAGSYMTTTVATLTIGGVSDTFSVTTKEASVITLSPVANRTMLWPPDNKMVVITIKANASDSSGGPVTLTAAVSCNEQARLGQDWTTPVINQKKGVITLSLRATRNGSGTGRIYTITITATGAGGNSATKAVTVTVPHDQRVRGR